MSDNIARPTTPAELIALGPQQRLEFFRGLPATSPEIAACLIYTVLNDVRPQVAIAYYESLKYLVDGADPLQVYIHSSRFVNTARAPQDRLALHQYMAAELDHLLRKSGRTYSYVRHDSGLIFFGTLGRRTVTLCADELHEGDMVVYNCHAILPKQRTANGRWPEVEAHRVEVEDQSLPTTLGLTQP